MAMAGVVRGAVAGVVRAGPAEVVGDPDADGVDSVGSRDWDGVAMTVGALRRGVERGVEGRAGAGDMSAVGADCARVLGLRVVWACLEPAEQPTTVHITTALSMTASGRAGRLDITSALHGQQPGGHDAHSNYICSSRSALASTSRVWRESTCTSARSLRGDLRTTTAREQGATVAVAVRGERASTAPDVPVEPGRLGSGWNSYVCRSPQILARLTSLFGLLTLLHAFLGDRVPELFTSIAPEAGSDAATAVTAASGLLLLRLSGGLRRRQLRAWRAACVLLALLAVAHVVRGISPFPLLITLLLLGLLLASGGQFQAKADVTSRWLALRNFVQLSVISLGYGLALLYVDVHTRVAGNPSFQTRLTEVLDGLVGVNGPAKLVGPRFPMIFHGTLIALGLVIAFSTVYLLLRPTHPRANLSAEDETRLRALLTQQGGRDSLGYFALRRDKSVVWSPTGKAAITYRVVSGVALVSGDPVGDPEAWPGAIAAYQALVDEYAWIPAVIGCSETGATVLRREAGLSALQLGDEAIIEVGDFTLEGRAMRGVRQACTRVQRAGYEVAVRRISDVPATEMATLTAAADKWRGNDIERGYSMALSRLGDPADNECVVATASLDGKLKGVLHFVPWGSDGLSLDLMRRDRAADNGLNELMIVSVIQDGPALGVRRVSLNFAVFRDALERGERIGAGPILRLWRGILIFLSRWFQIESLYRFNVKFRPDWEPRFLSFPSSSALPRISVAALEAEAFITRPRLVNRVFRR